LVLVQAPFRGRAVDDGIDEGPHTSTIVHTALSNDRAYNQLDIPNVIVYITDTKYVYFADRNLQAAVEEKLEISSPTTTDMLALTWLDARSRGIVDLTGLQYARNLVYLYLSGNQISDISPLSGLRNVRSLNLTSNLLNPVAYCVYLPLIASNNPGISLSYDPDPDPLLSDLNEDCRVNWADFTIFAAHWLDVGCDAPDWCEGADLNHGSAVTWLDFTLFAEQWLECRAADCD